MIKKISQIEIQTALDNTTRQYLVGQLKQPQILQHINDNLIEIGISNYTEYTTEAAHTHGQAYEYQFTLSGQTIYLDITNKQEHTFNRGDFYRIEPGTHYVQKCKAGTRILFIKVPPGNDKINIDHTESIQKWLDNGMKTIRTDFYHDPHAPAANSIKPAVAVAILNQNHELLLLKRKDSGNWTMPGGTHEFGESLVETATRETKEETGLDINITHLIGTYTDPDIRIAYNDGETRQEFSFLYLATCGQKQILIDSESTDYCWSTFDNLIDLPFALSQKRRIEDLRVFLQDYQTKLR
jgi:8-oxo-dGTP diphosphatase